MIFKAYDENMECWLSHEEILDEIESEGSAMLDHILRQDHYRLYISFNEEDWYSVEEVEKMIDFYKLNNV
jgi:hypothetical protein